MPFDVVFAVALVAASALVTTTLSFALARTPRGRLTAAAAIAAWFVAVLVLGGAGVLRLPGLGTAGLGAAVLAPTVVLSWRLLKSRGAGVPTPVLIAIQGLRVLGVAFVLLYAAHRLPAPFAPTAGWGDIAVGLAALPVAWLWSRRGGRSVALVWGLLGCLDLASAVSLGALSSPGPARLFMEPPGSAAMTTLPWILIPAFLVPGFFALHVATFQRLGRRDAADDASMALAHSSRRSASGRAGFGPRALGGFFSKHKLVANT